jgi:hypothetical protein
VGSLVPCLDFLIYCSLLASKLGTKHGSLFVFLSVLGTKLIHIKYPQKETTRPNFIEYYEKIMSVTTCLFNCNLILSNIFFSYSLVILDTFLIVSNKLQWTQFSHSQN